MERITVFVPCYNAEKYIDKMLDSILGQTYKNFKILIVDDGSSDRSKDIIREYAVRDKRVVLYENAENQGVARVRNRGLELCRSEYIALMDADDVAPLDRLETEVRYLDEHMEIDAVGGRYQLIDEEGKELPVRLKGVLSDSAIRASMLFYNPLANGSMMFRSKIIRENNLRYCEQNRTLEDYLFWSEFLRYGKINNLDQVLQYYRVSETSIECQAQREDRRNRDYCFDLIHENMYQILGINLKEEEKKLLKKATHDTSDLKGLSERIQFLKALYYVKRQGRNRDKEFETGLKCVCREYASKELKNLLKGIIGK